jgi:hypothetical protein
MKDEPINRHNLVERLRVAFPEIEDRLKEQQSRASDGKPGNYIVFGIVFDPFFKKELAQEKITDFLRRLATFIEEVCNSADSEAINVVWIEIFEWLIHEPKYLRLLWPILGPATKASIEDAARRWGKAANLPLSGIPGAIGSAFRRR